MIKLFISKNNNPKYNLAVEEYLTYTKLFNEPVFFIWQNENTIVVGRNQDTYSQIDIQKTQLNNVNVVRRNTGGGTVFQDLGNICYSIITNNESSEGYQESLKPIINFLKSKNVEAKFSGRNDIEVDGFKISGNAKLKTSKKTLIHGTLLFDVDLTKLSSYLVVNKEKLISKKIQSVQSRVKNIIDLMNEKESIEKFKNDLINYYLNNNNFGLVELTEEDNLAINQLMVSKYDTWDWNFGKNLSFDFKNVTYLPEKGTVDIRMNTLQGIIKEIKFFGDFLGYIKTDILEEKLINEKFEINNIRQIISEAPIKEIFGENFEVEDLINIMFI